MTWLHAHDGAFASLSASPHSYGVDCLLKEDYIVVVLEERSSHSVSGVRFSLRALSLYLIQYLIQDAELRVEVCHGGR